jgi:GT2 family glycosyltransferase
MRLSIVLVHYHTPELACGAIAALRADLAESGLAGEILLVDNGSNAAGRRQLEALGVVRLDPGSNLGFAGGVNLGVAAASGELLVIMNPDVEVLPGCLGSLAAELAAGAAIAGPRFFWDHGRRFLLPPTERRTRWSELRAALAPAGSSSAGGRAAWRRHARRHWTARAALPSHELSGGLLAFRRTAWEAVGPFDEGYRLYFEETDWLLRARRRGLTALYVPAAPAVHLVGRSAAAELQAPEWFEESARRFRRRHYGRPFAALLERLAARADPGADVEPGRSASGGPALLVPGAPVWVEVSPNRSGFPAAAEHLPQGLAADWSLPAEVVARLAPARLTLQVADEAGRELARCSLALPAARETA